MIPDISLTTEEKKRIQDRVPGVRRRLLDNLRRFPGEEVPILIAGDVYNGIWVEHNQDNLFLAEYAPENAWASQKIFMDHQRADGMIPLMVRLNSGEAMFKQLQMVWPLTRCALEIARKTHRPESDFARIYRSGCEYDRFLGNFRDHRHWGLTEMWCEYDTGHDRSPRSSGLQPGNCEDAAVMPDLPELPVCAPDLSAMRFQMRQTLAELAEMLGKPEEARQWADRAEETKTAIRRYLYDPEEDFYFDLGPRGFRKYRTEHLSRLFLNRVVDQQEFDRLYHRWFESEQEFLTPFPFPSVSVSDPAFMKDPGPNCWGGNVQALTALRALLWLEYYHRPEEKTRLLKQWMKAFLDFPDVFPQELDPFTGKPVRQGGNYTPALLLFLEGAKAIGG